MYKKKPKLLAHRGFTKKFHENTFESFFESLFDMRIDGVELDVCQTSDRELVCFHDINLERLTGVNIDINQITYTDLEKLKIKKNNKYKFESNICPFGTMLDLFNFTSKILNIELKIEEDDSQFVENVLYQISKRNMENNVIITSFNHKLLKYVDKNKFKIGSINDFDICSDNIDKMNLDYPITILDKRTSKETIDKLKEMGKIIGVYTLNSYDDNIIDNFNQYDVDYLIFDKL
jgi:glycerophosphoryl diester phosphodiesterase